MCVCAQAIDALKEIFLVALLPDRKLKFFEQQPLAAVPANKEGSRRLLLWYVEDCLKKRYSSFVTGLEECSRDNLEFLKDKALKAMYDLLRSKSEQVTCLRLVYACYEHACVYPSIPLNNQVLSILAQISFLSSITCEFAPNPFLFSFCRL